MAEERKIKTIFEVEGAEQSAAAVERLATSVQDAFNIEELSKRLEDVEKNLGNVAGKFGAASGQVAAFARAIGAQTLERLATFGQQLAQSAQAGAELGRTVGPGGALVGGLLGAALPAIQRVTQAIEEGTIGSAAFEERIRGLASAARTAIEATRDLEDARAGVFGSDTSGGDLQRGMDTARARLLEIERMISRERQAQQRQRITEDSTAIPALRAQADEQRRILANLEREIGRRYEAAAATQEQTEAIERQTDADHLAAEEAARREAQSRAMEERYQREEEAWERYNRAVQSGIELQNEGLQRQIATLDALAEKARAHNQERIDQATFARESLDQLREETETANHERMRAQQEADDDLIESNREAHQKAREDTQETADLVNAASRGMVKAITETITGAKSADEAFRGMLAAFLEAIAEQALTRAAFEYAEAIASFATIGMSAQGAMHLAAGLAFTAVAVGAGVAAAAVAPPAAGPPAESPDRAPQGEGGGGGTVFVNNWNAPQVVAGTEAEVGRTLDRLGRAAGSRFGRIAA